MGHRYNPSQIKSLMGITHHRLHRDTEATLMVIIINYFVSAVCLFIIIMSHAYWQFIDPGR